MCFVLRSATRMGLSRTFLGRSLVTVHAWVSPGAACRRPTARLPTAQSRRQAGYSPTVCRQQGQQQRECLRARPCARDADARIRHAFRRRHGPAGRRDGGHAAVPLRHEADVVHPHGAIQAGGREVGAGPKSTEAISAPAASLAVTRPVIASITRRPAPSFMLHKPVPASSPVQRRSAKAPSYPPIPRRTEGGSARRA
jgi:hypothetical protein